MSTGNKMQVDASVILQEAEVRETFLVNRTLLLSQQLLMQKQENQILLDKINGLEADLRKARDDGEE
ncbi:hypothetical protein G6L26_007275 [Agrobacterium radiobacter]|uniref:Uncharacterized protein n=1 Tax=Agrobacterium tumefaciens str. B6 TaxID=1183423 RepID=A0A822UY66_AGRTU|nr:hypothetical protein [Agrobacterium tumefaciens]KWT87983.1 hypothetical protein ASB65_18275 [Agrobacterium tumefaciens str. B6]MQB28223.1 hypothetical protein [Agrobacterium tumefaciens]NTA04974.1 hypothetical protein [Agrobacterium tumefaciens]NTA91569.1 hypothetical protein [Agrobacterium tumefaciens]NTB12718.1 hypothetical protein [Agrobacterium tumefaciens]